MQIIYNQNGLTIVQLDVHDDNNGRVERRAVDDIIDQYYGLKVNRHSNGAPFLVSSELHISISHTAKFVSTYVSKMMCGVDIELKTRNAEKIARKFTDENEVEIAKHIYPQNPHLLIWCAKEALYKYFSVDGSELKKDFLLTSASSNEMIFEAFTRELVKVYFFEHDNLIVAHT